jgi:hypothetical protein
MLSLMKMSYLKNRNQHILKDEIIEIKSEISKTKYSKK